VPKQEIKLYYNNVMANVIGDEHGITKKQWADLKKKVQPLIPKIMEEIIGHESPPKKTRTVYGLLPTKKKIAKDVRKLVDGIDDPDDPDYPKEGLKKGCENLVVFGIGGSALGNIALQTALNPYMYNMDENQREDKDKQTRPRLFVFDNVDPAQLKSFLNWLGGGLNKTVFNVISKSGKTSETAAQFMIIRDMLINKLSKTDYQKRVVATTDADKKKSILRKIAKTDELQTLEVPDDVGGRFSVLSAVGLFSAAMCGIDIDFLLEGARDMNTRISEDFDKNPAAINAAINYHFYTHGKPISVMMPYSYALKDMADWYRQLWAESLGKVKFSAGNEVHIGPTPVKALGVTDQHSQVQLYREGPNDKLFTFLQVNNFEKDIKIGPAPDGAEELGFLAGKNLSALLNDEKKATEYALLTDKRPCLTVLFDRVNAYTIGQFIYLYEVTTSFVGALFGINPYDQPAVELGKEATFALMGKTGDYEDGYTYEQFAGDIQIKTNVDKDFLV